MHRLLAILLVAGAVAAEDSFTIAVTPDSQQEILQANDTRPVNRTQWIAGNRAALNIKAMLHVGDMMNWDTSDHIQYQRASAALAVLDNAAIPCSLAIGNHDTAATKEGGSAAPGNVNTNLRNTATFNTYFPASRVRYEGYFEAGKVDNAFRTFHAADRDWLVLNIELWPRAEAVAWAKGVVAGHPNHNVMIVTHSFLTGSSTIEQSNGGYGNTSPQYLFDQVVKPYANVRLVFSGHVGTHGYRTDAGANGNTVYEFLQCYHSNTANPVRMFTIDTRAGTIKTWVYCPNTGTTMSDGSSFTVSGVQWVAPAAVKPTITTQPVGKTVGLGQPVAFSVAATGTAPLTYQWRRGGTVVGGNSASLAIASVQAGDAGSYTCMVSNVAGSAVSAAVTLTVSGIGWQGTYYDNRDFTGTRVQRTDPQIAFDWGTGAPVAGFGVDTFSVRWRGVVRAPASGTWTFTATADDGVRVWVGGRRVIDRWIDQSPTAASGQAVLAAGQPVEVVMEYYENGGGAVASLAWAGPGHAGEPVAAEPASGDDLPGGWSAADVGGVAAAGSASEAGGTWTIVGSGADIWNAADGFRFVSQPVSGDLRLTARVVAVGDTDAWAKAGVMVRESGAAGSRHAFTCVTPGNGVAFQRRLATGGTSSHTAGPARAAPYWVRIERVGDVLIGSCSADGVGWSEIRRDTVTMGAAVLAGLAVTAHQDGAVCTASFSSVELIAATPAAN